MAESSSKLYRWERLSKPRLYSRSQRVTTDTDIKDWIKTVEDASERAAATAFGRETFQSRKNCTKATVHARVQDAQLHEAAYAEAQDLLQQWVNEKIRLDADVDCSDEAWSRNTEADIKKEWNHLLSSDADLEIDALVNDDHRSTAYSDRLSARSKDPYATLRRDPDDLVNEVLERMYDTEVVPSNITRDLGLDDDVMRRPDPRTKMALRHQQVKENREKRLRDKEKKLRELQSKKDATFQARQILMKEEKVKENRKKKEEQSIQAEMAKIRKEMEEERKKQAEERSRMKKEQEEMERKTNDEYERQKEHEAKQKRKSEYQTEERRKQILKKMQEIEVRRVTENMRIKQRCFSAWYNLVIDKRLQTGRANAMRDWRLMGRMFNAWKAFTREKRLTRQAWAHEENIKQTNRQVAMAEEFWRHTLLRKCMTAWQLFVSQQQASKEVEKEHQKTKQKMQAFLQAAQTGQLWSGRGDDDVMTDRTSASAATNSTTVTAMFAKGKARRVNSASNSSTSRSDASSSRPSSQSHRQTGPTDAWLINRKLIQPTKEELKAIKSRNTLSPYEGIVCTCQEEDSADRSERTSPCAKCQQSSSPETQGNKPWRKAPYAVNNFEHRHAAQQKILEMQQKQIQEQQRLIEELQYLQKQQMLQQKLLQEENAKIHSGTGATTEGADGIHKTLHHLQNHIAQLQQQLLENGASQLDSCANNTGPSPENEEDENSSVQDIRITDLESEEENTPNFIHSHMKQHGLKLDLSQVVENDKSENSRNNSNRSNSSNVKRNKFGQTKVLSKKEQPSSVRSTASSQVSTQVPGTERSGASGASRHETFLKSMEERARERQRIKREREEKKRQEEEQKMAELFAREAEMRKAEEEEKQRRIEAHREKKRTEKQREKEKQEFVERMKLLNQKADEHYRRALLKWRGIYAFRKLVSDAHEKFAAAANHHETVLLRKAFTSWHMDVAKDINEKNKMADQFHNYLVTKRCFTNWTKVNHANEIQMEKARRHHETRVKVNVLRVWADFAAEEKVSMWHKERLAREHNPIRIKKTYFKMWRRFPEMRREEEEKEKRRAEMRKKVANLLPDYSGVSTSQSLSTSKDVLM